MTELTDEELMFELTQGDQSAFATLYLRHKGRLMAYLINKTKSPSLAEEILQVSFEKIYTKSHLFNSEYKFLPWFFTIAHNTFLDAVKKRTERSEPLQEPVDDKNYIYNDSPEVDLSTLSINQKKALELKFWKDEDYIGIAQKLKTTEPNARKLISRALLKLRTTLKPEEK